MHHNHYPYQYFWYIRLHLYLNPNHCYWTGFCMMWRSCLYQHTNNWSWHVMCAFYIIIYVMVLVHIVESLSNNKIYCLQLNILPTLTSLFTLKFLWIWYNNIMLIIHRLYTRYPIRFSAVYNISMTKLPRWVITDWKIHIWVFNLDLTSSRGIDNRYRLQPLTCSIEM